MPTKQLVPCPFCGEPPETLWMRITLTLMLWRAGWHIECGPCGAEGPKRVTRQRAIDSWNHREQGHAD